MLSRFPYMTIYEDPLEASCKTERSLMLLEAEHWYDMKGFCLRLNSTRMMTGNMPHAYLSLAFAIIFLASSCVLPTKESLLIAISWSPGRSRPS